MKSPKFVAALYAFFCVCGQEGIDSKIIDIVLDGITADAAEKKWLSHEMLKWDNAVREVSRVPSPSEIN